MGWAGGLVWFPSKHRWTQEKTKIGALQNACPKFISRPQTQSSYKLVSYRMVGLEICLTCTCPTFPGKPRNLFPKNTLFTKWHGWPKKKSLQNASVCYKNAPGMGHGSSHFKVEIYTGIDLVGIIRARLRVVPEWSYERQWEAHFSAQAQCSTTLVHLWVCVV